MMDQDQGYVRQTNTDRPKRTLIALVLVFTLVFGFSVGMGMMTMKAWLVPAGFDSGIGEKPYSEAAVSEGALPISAMGEDSEERIVRIVENAAPSVVAITNKVYYKDMFSNSSVESGAGSGVIFRMDAESIFMLTNNHVIEGATDLVVEFYNGSKANATLVGTDKLSDLAIVKVAKKDLPSADRVKMKPIVLGDSDKIKVGQTAIAIGNPLNYGTSVTVGVVSAVNRQVEASGIERMIQTDAAINPGNSGGALVDSSGRLIGINTIKIADTEVEGIGFAIPVNSAKPIIEQLFSKGYVSRPYLGIYGQVIDETTSQFYNIPVGIMIMDVVKGAGADKAGLMRGDVLISIDGAKINSMNDLSKFLNTKKVGDKIRVKVYREGKSLEKQVTLTDQKVQE